MNHDFVLVWLTDDLEGFRCKNCGFEIVDEPDSFENDSCPHVHNLVYTNRNSKRVYRECTICGGVIND